MRWQSGGAMATIARRAATRCPPAETTTPSSPRSIRDTGAPSTGGSASAAAMRSEISCEPPTKRSCWAPSSTSISGLKPPADRTYQSA